jgi:hypothetical protein
MRSASSSPSSFETLVLFRAAQMRAHRATSSSSITVTFFMGTKLVPHELRFNFRMAARSADTHGQLCGAFVISQLVSK